MDHMFSKRALRQTWADVRPYFVFSAIVFFASFVVGGSNRIDTSLLEQQAQALESLAGMAGQSEHPRLFLFLIVLINNVFKSIFTMYAGVIACIWPLFMLVTNGTLLGFLLDQVGEQGGNPWMIFATAILPHGIFELPAIFLACAFGLRFGVMLFRGLAGSVRGKPDAWKGFVQTATGSVPGMVIVSLLLLAGAIVESTLSLWLASLVPPVS
jgi:stage II sporulation protein M